MSQAQDRRARYLVVDASVSLKWALDDEDAVAEALALRDAGIDGTIQMVAPSLWLYEVTNGLLAATRQGRMDAALGRQALELVVALGVRLADPPPGDVYDLARSYGVAAYDAAYVTLAEALSSELWTGDRRLYNALRVRASFVHWIGDFPAGGSRQ